MLTHKELESMVDEFMETQDWVKVKISNELFKRKPDRMYTKGSLVLIFELKPENILQPEVDRGIGQCMGYLPYRVKPYLVIPEVWATYYRKIFAQLPFLGVLQYSNELSMVQPATDRLGDLQEFPQLEIRLTRLFLWRFLKKRVEDGLHSLDSIEDLLSQAYPLVKFYRQTIARMLLSMGYGRERYNPTSMEYDPFGKGSKSFFHIILHRNLRGAGIKGEKDAE